MLVGLGKEVGGKVEVEEEAEVNGGSCCGTWFVGWAQKESRHGEQMSWRASKQIAHDRMRLNELHCV